MNAVDGSPGAEVILTIVRVDGNGLPDPWAGFHHGDTEITEGSQRINRAGFFSRKEAQKSQKIQR
jgi:hypothetical protein